MRKAKGTQTLVPGEQSFQVSPLPFLCAPFSWRFTLVLPVILPNFIHPPIPG